MLKILNAEQIRNADAYTIQHEPISSLDLMERAATQVSQWLINKLLIHQKVAIVCGMGNNGGDGLIVARQLKEYGFENIDVFVVKHTDNPSNDFSANYERLKQINNIQIIEITDIYSIENFEHYDCIVDAILGSGLNKPIQGLIKDIVLEINKTKAIVVSIDIPTGLFAEDNSGNDLQSIINADFTLTFELPKLSFLLPEFEFIVGEWIVLPIWLHKDIINATETFNYFVQKNDISSILRKRPKHSHKGNYGHALLLAGSKGKMGAAVLSAKACLKSGVGLLTTYIPQCGYDIMQTSLPEAMCLTSENINHLENTPTITIYNAIGIGPGIGTESETQNILKNLIQLSTVPLVIDADAINILSENKTWLSFLPAKSILTPHPKEFERLVGKCSNTFERIQKGREFARKFNVYLVLKGAYTAIITPDNKCFFNSTGNPGMATAGSGDVLTGILLSLLAQGYSSFKTCLLGVYLHGLSGDKAAEKLGFETLIASDIIDNIGNAYKELYV